MNRFDVTADPLNAEAIVASVSTAECGAVATFVGLVRDHNAGRRVLWLDYEAYRAAGGEGVRADRRRSGGALAVGGAGHSSPHRAGWRSAKPASSIAAASPHRADAFAACRYAIERIKQIAPIWKHEHFEGGEVWIEGATADPDDEAARQAAFERACS